MKFGVREICNVVFRTTANGQNIGDLVFAKAGTPCFRIDTAKTSSLEQATTTVYATGGRGNTRLLSWEGEKTMTFTVEDALISPMGLGVLSGAGLIKGTDAKPKHVHVSIQKDLKKEKIGSTDNESAAAAIIDLEDLRNATGLFNEKKFYICDDTGIPVYASYAFKAGVIDSSDILMKGTSGSAVHSDSMEVTEKQSVTFYTGKVSSSGTTYNTDNVGETVIFDFYILVGAGAEEIVVKPGDFGGYFYIEAQTLFRREDNGKDMAAEIILPKVKVNSGFTFSMASSGDPSTFTFTMDALPGYTTFDKTNKVMCIMQTLSGDVETTSTPDGHVSDINHPAAQG